MKRFNVVALIVFFSILGSASLAMASLTCWDNTDSNGYAAWEVKAKAQPDECFYEVGSTKNEYPMTGPCKGTFKRNEGYIWGMTKFQDKIFFGTASNVACLVAENYLLVDEPVKDPDYVCEFGYSAFPAKDFRYPSMYVYTKRDGLRELELPDAAEKLLKVTVGIRSAGVHPSGIVLMAGPMIKNYGAGINMFAFSGQNGALLGAANLEIGDNIRNIYTTRAGEIYLGVGGMESGSDTGSVFKWKGNVSAIFGGDMRSLFDFDEVGSNLDGEAAQLAEHEGRLFVTTWPDSTDPNNYAGLWMSPRLPLTKASAGGWEKIWSADEYEPFNLAAKLYGGGALHSFDGYLYWGTMHVPGMIYYYFTEQAGGEPEGDRARALLADETNRAFSLFRGKSFGTNYEKIELLYGGYERSWYGGGYFRVFDPDSEEFYGAKNLMGLTPKYGEGGIGNKYGNYCWSMNVYGNDLYIGTMDYSPLTQYFLNQVPPYSTFGGDLFRIDSADDYARTISDDGMGNENQYGIRTMVSDRNSLFLGTAGNSNLQPGGGWELIELRKDEWSERFVYSGPCWAEAEGMRRSREYRTEGDGTASEDYVIEGSCTWGSCRAITDFYGNSGKYNIAVRYYDPGFKSSGSWMKLYVDGSQVAEKSLTQDQGWYYWHVDGITLSNGSEVEVETSMDRRSWRNKFAMDFIDFVPAGAVDPDPGPDPDPDPDDDPSYGGDGNDLDLSLLQYGDFIMLSGVISDTTIPGGTWTHVAIYVGNGQIVEAWSPSVRKVPATILQTASDAAIYRVETSGAVKQAAVEFAVRQLGKPYDYSWTNLWSGTKDVDGDSWYCSELIWAAYRISGVELDSERLSRRHVVPTELTETGNVSPVSEQPDLDNLSLNQPVKASDYYSYSYRPSYAVDGNSEDTRWATRVDGYDWIYVNLGSTKTLYGMNITWHDYSYAEAYDVQRWNNGDWETMETFTDQKGGTTQLTFSAPFTAQYVRLNLDSSNGRYYSLFEWELMGE